LLFSSISKADMNVAILDVAVLNFAVKANAIVHWLMAYTFSD